MMLDINREEHREALRYVCEYRLGSRYETDSLVQEAARCFSSAEKIALLARALLERCGVESVGGFAGHAGATWQVWADPDENGIRYDGEDVGMVHVPMLNVFPFISALLDAKTRDEARSLLREVWR